MKTLRTWFLRLGGLFGKQRCDRELADELESHLQMHTEDNLRAGMTPDEARRQAVLKLGGIEQTKEKYRDRRGIAWIESLLKNIRYALRQFRLSPVFTAAAVLTLALGIGGTTAIFTLIHAVMLHSLPVSDPASLYRIGDGNDCCVQGGPQNRWGMFSFPLYERLKDAAPEFEQVAAFQAGPRLFTMRRQGVESTAKPLWGEFVTGNYFLTLGVGSFGGRVLLPRDDSPVAPPVVVLSHRVWQTAYGGDASVVGSTFIIQGHPFTVIGVAPPGFFGETLRSDPPDIWIPLQQEPIIDGHAEMLHQPVSAWLRVIGRLRPGASIAGLAPRLTGVLRQWIRNDSSYPANWMPDVIRTLPEQVVNVLPAGAGVAVMKEEYGRSLQILLSVCALVLLIACANVANLLLARAFARRGQTAVRIALGATRRQIVAQALTGSVLLAMGGGIAGLLVATAAARLLLALAFQGSHFLPIATAPSPLVLSFAFALALVTGIIFGTAPAWFAMRTHPAEALRESGRGAIDRSSFARKGLLIVQATVSVALVAGAMMLARSLDNLEHQDFGYQVQGRVVIGLQNLPATYTPAQSAALYRQLEENMAHLPGVQGAGLATNNPLADNMGELIMVAGHPAPTEVSAESLASWDRVSANYLQGFGMPILRGRGFTAADNETSEPVAVVDEAFVKRFFKSDEDPLDQHFGIDLPENAGTFHIVGIVRNAKFNSWGLRRPALPMFFVPLAQNVAYKNDVLKRVDLASHWVHGIMLVTNASPGILEPQLTRMLAELDPNLTISSIRTMQEHVDFSFDQERAVASLAALFGVVALMLAAVGLYGVTAYAVARRTNEIGIRMALGADRTRVVRLILHGAFKQVAMGLVLGLPLAIGAGHLISAQLYGVASWDPLALTVAAGTLAVCSLFAAMIPASRAANVDPMVALRHE